MQFLLSDSSDPSHSRNKGLGHSDPGLPLSPRQEHLYWFEATTIFSNSALFVLRFLKSQQKTRRKKEAVTAGCGLCSTVPSQFRDINVPQLSQILVWDIPVHLQTVFVGDTR